ncbi:hypothetical protein AZ78_4492 [Lysobacter capsici AZ78]|uniref:Uncharacterized protein n=1 Tax=Lysobacter capsici AZ78 TaxID=1444315 RepID=A0A108UD37_9GAMM|nr:hypothetical protein AZ78_4492 [Lysobacter capsici AZ78]
MQRPPAVQRQIHGVAPDWPPRAGFAADSAKPIGELRGVARESVVPGTSTVSPRRNAGQPGRPGPAPIGSFEARVIGPPDDCSGWLA